MAARRRGARKGGAKTAAGDGVKVVATNRKARHDYEIVETYEAGIALAGSEVKSIRAGDVNLRDSFARVKGGEAWLHGMHVKPYEFAKDPPEADRPRKLLLRRREIDSLIGTTANTGVTLIPLRLYFTHGLAKVEIGVAKGRKKHDKRRVLAERQARLDAERALKERGF